MISDGYSGGVQSRNKNASPVFKGVYAFFAYLICHVFIGPPVFMAQSFLIGTFDYPSFSSAIWPTMFYLLFSIPVAIGLGLYFTFLVLRVRPIDWFEVATVSFLTGMVLMLACPIGIGGKYLVQGLFSFDGLKMFISIGGQIAIVSTVVALVCRKLLIFRKLLVSNEHEITP